MADPDRARATEVDPTFDGDSLLYRVPVRSELASRPAVILIVREDECGAIVSATLDAEDACTR